MVYQSPDRYKLSVSDGAHFMGAIFAATQLSAVTQIEANSIIEINECICIAVGAQKVAVLLSIDIKTQPVPKIGNPLPIETCEPPIGLYLARSPLTIDSLEVSCCHFHRCSKHLASNNPSSRPLHCMNSAPRRKTGTSAAAHPLQHPESFRVIPSHSVSHGGSRLARVERAAGAPPPPHTQLALIPKGK